MRLITTVVAAAMAVAVAVGKGGIETDEEKWDGDPQISALMITPDARAHRDRVVLQYQSASPLVQ